MATAKMRLVGRTAVITGAAGGIGRAIARSLAHRGANLALADVNEAGLAETAAGIGGVTRISRHVLDVADGVAVAALPQAVQAVHGRVDILVNNAGVALGGSFEQVAEADFDWLFEINFFGVVRMTRAFLPLMHESDDARLVNLSSVFGIVAPAGQAAYAASKFAVRGFSEALRRELRGTTVGVTTVHPGGVATGIARSARVPAAATQAQTERGVMEMEKFLRLAPETAGEVIARSIEARRPRVLVGNDAKLLCLAERLSPVNYLGLLRPKRAAR